MNTDDAPDRQPLPSELPSLRKGRRKRKIPDVFAGMRGHLVDRGRFRFRIEGDRHEVQWFIGPEQSQQAWKSALWSELCCNPALELERLELGWLIADVCMERGNHMMKCIPAPNEAMKEAAPYWSMGDAWYHWAVVAAGHMVFPKE